MGCPALNQEREQDTERAEGCSKDHRDLSIVSALAVDPSEIPRLNTPYPIYVVCSTK
jgi:hypothetical protein